MKKLLLLASLLAFMGMDLNAKPLKVTRKGSKDGIHFDFVVQDPGFWRNELKCLKPGSILCSWVDVRGSNHSAVIKAIHEKIETAVLGGSTSGSISGEGYSGTWTGSLNQWGAVDYTFEGETED